MDEEYAKQICGIMNRDQVHVKVSYLDFDANTGQQASSSSYCPLAFPSSAQAGTQTQTSNCTNSNGPITMTNSSKQSVLDCTPPFPASSIKPNTPIFPATVSQPPFQHQRDYSIFVGDLSQEVSNTDLVTVFHNPFLGLRNDREPKFIRPFLSCKGARIVFDPITGLSRGFGFVRFVDKADQQRALIEMHGLYCLSRPMRISPATHKYYKHAPSQAITSDVSQVQHPNTGSDGRSLDALRPATIFLPPPTATRTMSVSDPLAFTTSNNSPETKFATGSGPVRVSSVAGCNSAKSTTAPAVYASLLKSVTSKDIVNVPNDVLA